jgi:integrase
MKLTQAAVKALALPADKTDAIFFDSEMPGFGYRLRQLAGGRVGRSWVVQYRIGRRTRRLLLGSAAVLGAEQARIMARKALGRVANGEDVQASRLDRRYRDKYALKAAVADFLKMKQPAVRPPTYRELVRYLTGDAYFGPLHGMPLDQIGRKDVAACLNQIIQTNGPLVARHARGALSGFYVWALGCGLCEANPVIGTIRPATSAEREHVLTDAELAAVWRACDSDDYGKCVKLLILTGCRRQEIGGIAWSELNLEGPQPSWTLPKSRSKNGRAHTLPLLPNTLAILKAVPRMASRDQLFGTKGTGFVSWSRGKEALDRRSGVSGWVVHDIRRSVATGMATIGVMPHIVETVLNHYDGHRRGVAGIYNHSRYEHEVRAALALWEKHISALVEGGKTFLAARVSNDDTLPLATEHVLG